MAVSAKRVRWALAAIGIVALPLLGSPIWHDVSAMGQLEALARALPDRTYIVRSGTAVERVDGRCHLVLAKVVASELDAARVRAFHGRRSAAGDAEFLAWSSPGAFWVRRSNGSEPPTRLSTEGDSRLPGLVSRMLLSWMILPDGVRRIVLFRVTPSPAALDPRCLS